MSRNRSQRQQNPGLEDPLDQILIHNGLAQLIPHGPRDRTGARGDRREANLNRPMRWMRP